MVQKCSKKNKKQMRSIINDQLLDHRIILYPFIILFIKLMKNSDQRIQSYFRNKNQERFSPTNLRPPDSPHIEKTLKPQLFSKAKVSKEVIEVANKPLEKEQRKNLQTQKYSSNPRNQYNNNLNMNYFHIKKQQSPNEEDYYKNKQTEPAFKFNRPLSNNRERELDQRNPVLIGNHSQKQLLKKNPDFFPQKARTPTAQMKIPDIGKRTQLSQYQKLHQKLNTLENKIATMKINLQKKKAEKQSVMQKERRDKKSKEVVKGIDGKDANKKIQRVQKSSKQKAKGENVLKGVVTQVPKQNKQLHNFDHNPYSPRHNMYYVSQIVKAYKQQNSLAREHLLTSIQLLRLMDNLKKNMNSDVIKPLNLEQKSMYKGKKTVVFDLDQTLIHCNQSTSIPYDVKIPIKFPTGQVIDAGINIRPHAIQMLKALSVNFQIIVFTASQSCYANVVLDYLDPEKKYIQHRLFRQHCYLLDKLYIKDLRIINRKQSQMVLVDNAAYSYAFQVDNGIPIIPYYEGKNDYELKALQTYIQRLVWASDVREVNKKVFKLDKYKNYDEPQKLVKELYGQWIH